MITIEKKLYDAFFERISISLLFVFAVNFDL